MNRSPAVELSHVKFMQNVSRHKPVAQPHVAALPTLLVPERAAGAAPGPGFVTAGCRHS